MFTWNMYNDMQVLDLFVETTFWTKRNFSFRISEMAERAFFVLIGLFVLQNYCYANFFESLNIKETAAGEKGKL